MTLSSLQCCVSKMQLANLDKSCWIKILIIMTINRWGVLYPSILAGGPDDTCCHGGYQSGLNGDDVWVVVTDWLLNKIMQLINWFCSWKKTKLYVAFEATPKQGLFLQVCSFTPNNHSHHIFQLSPGETDLWWCVPCTTLHHLNTASLYQFRASVFFDRIENHNFGISK